jgi:uncharacterized protein with HEPN domain
MSKRDKQRVEDILTSISIIEAFVKDKSLIEFESDVMLHSAVQYQFLIIGEAAGTISPQILQRHDFPWSYRSRFEISLFTNITM